MGRQSSGRTTHAGDGIVRAAARRRHCSRVMAVCVRAAAREVPATQIVFVRFVGSFLFMLAATRGAGLVPRSGNVPRLILRGVIGAVSITLYFVGIEGAGAGLATLVQNTYPVFAATLAVLLGDEVFSRRLGAALALSVVGALVVLGARIDLASATTLGILASIAASMSAGAAVVTAQHLRRSEGAAIITTWFMGVGVLVTAPALSLGVPVLHGATVALLVAVVLDLGARAVAAAPRPRLHQRDAGQPRRGDQRVPRDRARGADPRRPAAAAHVRRRGADAAARSRWRGDG